MHADADVARVTINSAEMMLLRVKVKKVGYHESLLAHVMFVGGLREIATSGIKGFRRLAAHRRFRASVPLSVASNQ